MRGALCVFLFLLPVQFALSPIAGVDLPVARLFSVGLILAWLWLGVLRREVRFAWDMTLGLFLSFTFWVGLSVFLAEEFSWAWRKMLFLVSFLPLFFVFREVLDRESKNALLLTKALIAGAALSAGIGIIQVFLQWWVPVATLFRWWTTQILPFFLGSNFAQVVAEYPSLLVSLSGTTVMRASALFPDPHMHAFFLGLAWPLAMFLAWKEKTRGWQAVTLLIFVADLLTFSRGAYLGLIGAGGILVIFFLAQQKQWFSKFALGFSLLVLVSFFPNPVVERFWSGFSMEDGSVVARLALAREAVGHIMEQPWVGVGLGNYPLVVKPSAGEREPIYAHNLWLDIAVETGVPAALFLMGVFGLTLWRLSTKWWETRDAFLVGVNGSLLIFLGHSLVETPLFSVQVLPAVLFVLAVGNTLYADSAKK